jgi:DegV family protein with EDD domain
MPNVAVVTDTTHYLPRELAEGAGLRSVSLYVNDGDGTRREADIADFGAFYDHLRTAPALPTTSQPSIGDFLAVYEPLLEAGRDIVSIHISGGISGTVESARQAAADALTRHRSRRIEVVDSRQACGALGAIALGAAAVAAAGGDADAVVRRAEAIREGLRIRFAVDTLEYLRRGGRIGAAQAWVGGALKIKPILSMEGGMLHPVERVRTAGRAFERMVDHLQERRDSGATVFMLQHIQAPDVVERLAERGREIYGADPLFVSEIGPVIGAHAGPGLVGATGVDGALLQPR